MNKKISTKKKGLVFLALVACFILSSLFLKQTVEADDGDDPRAPCEQCLNLVDQNYSDLPVDDNDVVNGRYRLYGIFCTRTGYYDGQRQTPQNACSTVNGVILGQGWIDIHAAIQRGGSPSSGPIQQMECDTCQNLCNYAPWNSVGQARNACMDGCMNNPARNGSLCGRNSDGTPATPPPPAGTPPAGSTPSSTPTKRVPYKGYGIFDIKSCQTQNGPANIDDPGKYELICIVQKATSMLMAITGAITVVMIIISGIGYMTSMGNPGQTAWAKKSLVGAIIGLIIVVMAYSMVKLLAILLG